MSTSRNDVICGDCLKILPKLPKAKVVFADPPDNLGLEYTGFTDKKTITEYLNWLSCVLQQGFNSGDIFWLSYFYRYQPWVFKALWASDLSTIWRQFIWRFTFGQHNKHISASF